MENSSSTSFTTSGILGSLSNLFSNAVASAEDRLRLLSVELHEEKQRLILIFVWISAAVITGLMAIGFVSLTIVFMFPPPQRVIALGGCALFYLAAFGALVIAFKRYLARQPQPFAATLEELKEDRACFRPEN